MKPTNIVTHSLCCNVKTVQQSSKIKIHIMICKIIQKGRKVTIRLPTKQMVVGNISSLTKPPPPPHTSSHIMIHIKQVKMMKEWPPSCRITKERVSFVCEQTRRAVVQTWSLSISVFYLFSHILTLLRTIFMIQAGNSTPGACGLYIFPIYCGNNTLQIVITLCTDPLHYINGFIQI